MSPSNPLVILAGIKQFGLAPDGSDLRDLAAAIERMEQERDIAQGNTDAAIEDYNDMLAENRRLSLEVGRLKGLVQELADDAEAEISARYKGTLHYPDQQRRYSRDMEVIKRARNALAGGAEK